ncbi:hypothetical protein Pcinc_007330 [Petrolisthes cinctipes]|uniref:G-protein coupled receptors family 2 profile 1 domain-containing protein n=1 Tax=Petrolisthes cinctipes TaxID=88211 RepID=A0AAE1GBA2_PETCI|nr:hypothetical protein Pcinc_007330 [Petrolisthes cinctipes]
MYCNATFDKIMCWPPTLADTMMTLPCPPVQGVDLKQTAYKTCTAEGRWQGKVPGDEEGAEAGDTSQYGWTNYTSCFTPDVRDLLNQLYSGTQEDAQVSHTHDK